MSIISIEKDWFKVWKQNYYPPTIKEGTILSIYSPCLLDGEEGNKNGDYTSTVTLGVFKYKEQNNLILFSMFPRAILNPADFVTHMRNLCYDYLNNSTIKLHGGCAPDVMLVPYEENSRNSLYKQLETENNSVTLRRFHYEKYGGNLNNLLMRALPRIIEGRVWIVANPMNYDLLRNVDAKFLATVFSYPSTQSLATVWALAQAIVYLERQGTFNDEETPRRHNRDSRKLY